jgi:putative PIN family toxin of toxin-antitoxin system
MIAKNVKIRVVFDTNIWISFLIGKRLSIVEKYISNCQIIIVTTNQLIEEIKEVTGREQLKKYFPEVKVLELIRFLETIAEKYEITPHHSINRDPKDNFLLDLISASKADYLVTGDKDLLTLNPFETTVILTATDFEKILTDE